MSLLVDTSVWSLALRRDAPHPGPEVEVGFYRMLIRRFPFALYYLIEAHTIDIYAILDCRRNPSWILQRLSEMFPNL